MYTAANEGQRMLWTQAVDSGSIDKNRARRFLVVTPDERLEAFCEETAAMNADGVPWGEKFQTPDGPMEGAPLHVLCRCGESIKYD